MTTALLISGYLRTFKFNLPIIKKIISDLQNVDIYIHITKDEINEDKYLNVINLDNDIILIQNESNTSLQLVTAEDEGYKIVLLEGDLHLSEKLFVEDYIVLIVTGNIQAENMKSKCKPIWQTPISEQEMSPKHLKFTALYWKNQTPNLQN